MLVGKLFNSISKLQLSKQLTINYDLNSSEQHAQPINALEDFHLSTNPANIILILNAKILILLIIAMFSSQFVYLLYILVPAAEDIYMIDTTINMFCVWLTLRFSDKYYYQL
eukprot:121849_1